MVSHITPLLIVDLELGSFLIFDESTSSLDKENQDNVFKLLDYLNKDKSMTN